MPTPSRTNGKKASNADDRGSAPSARNEFDSSGEKLIAVATELFGERGRAGVSIRDLATAAGVNVAAVHYHFGGKDELYAAVIERAFASTGTLNQKLDEQLQRARAAGTREAASVALRECVLIFVSGLFHGNRPSWNGSFVQREALDPTPAMDRVLQSVVGPTWRTCLALLELLRPDLAGTEALRFVAASIVGQCIFYQQNLRLVLFMFELPELQENHIRQAAAHIAEFSLAALDHYQLPESP